MKNLNFFEKLWEHSRTLRRVGLVLVMCLMAMPMAWGAKGFFSDGQWNIKYWNGGGSDKWGSSDSGYGNNSYIDLGVQTNLNLKGSWVKTWSNDNWTQSEVCWYVGFTNESMTYQNKVNKSAVQGNQTWNGFGIDYDLIANAPVNPGPNTVYMYWRLDNYVSTSTSRILYTIPGFTTTSTSQTFDNTLVSGTNDKTISFGTHYGTALTTGNCSITGTNSSEFSVRSITESGVTVRFSPSTPGNKSATLTITDAHGKTCTITLTAKTKHTVTYHTDGKDGGGLAPSDATQYEYNATVKVKDNTNVMTKTNKVFAGWATSSGSSTVAYVPGKTTGTDDETFNITGNVDLYPVWANGHYLIEPNTTTKDGANFLAPQYLTNTSLTVNGVNFSSKCYKTSNTKSSISGQAYDSGKMVVYDTQTDETDVTIYVYNSNSSTAKDLYYNVFKEGVAASSDVQVSVPAKGSGTVIVLPHISNSIGSRVVICLNSSDLSITQIRTVETGEHAVKQAGQSGFALAVPGRPSTGLATGGVESPNQNTIKFGSGSTNWQVKGTNGSTSTQYIKFTTTSATQLQVTTCNDNYNTFYLKKGSAALNTSTDATYSGKNTTININLSETGTWYILGTQANIKKIAFADHVAATKPTSLTVGSITSTTARFTITDGTNSEWEIYWSTSNTAPTASTVPSATGLTSKTYDATGLTAGTTYYAWVRAVADYFNKSDWTALTDDSFDTDDTPSCSATAPGSISKGSASGGTGIITLTAAGAPATNNTWYWQSSASGEDKSTSGNTKNVNAAGTYYLRSYCSDNGGCWSDAVSVEVSAEDLLTTPTATFSNSYYIIGGSSLDLSSLWTSDSKGSVTYSVQSAGGTGASISTAAFTATTAGTATVRASQAANGNYSAITKDATITVLPGYVTSIDFEGIIDADESSSWKTTMEGRNYKLTQSNSSNWSMDDGTSGTKQADKGLKIKEKGDNAGKIAFAVHANQTVELKVGTLAGTGSGKASFSTNGGASYSDITGASTASTGTPVTYTYKGNADRVYVFKTKSSDWNILQHITIGYKVTYDKGSNGTGTVDPMYKTHGTSLTLSSSTFSRDDYEQDGWSTSDGGDKVYDLGGSYTSNAEITLYPHWIVACTDPGLAYATGSVTKTLCDGSFTNTLTNNHSVAVTYTSSNTSVADVASDGAITIKAAGSTTITASSIAQTVSAVDYCADEASYTLTVSASTAAGLAYGTSTVKKDVGDDAFTNSLTNTHSLTVTYTSSDESVATVASNGAVTIKAAGTTTITARSAQQEVSSTCYAAGEASYTLTVYPVYTVTYDATDGTCGTVSSKTVTGEVTLPTPTHASYSFDGWYTTAGVKAGNAGAKYSPSGNITLYAKWSGSCAGGGSCEYKYWFRATTDAPSAVQEAGKAQDDFFTNTPDGSSGGSSWSNKWEIDGVEYSATYRAGNSSNICTFTIPSGYTATLYLFGQGSSSRALILKEAGDPETELSGSAALTDNPFKVTISDLGAGTYTATASGNVGIAFIIVKLCGSSCYTVTYHGNGATSGYTNDPTAYDDENNDVTVLENGFTRTGYEFVGWNTEDDGSGTPYAEGATITDIAADVTLHAQWAAIKYFTNGASTGLWNNGSNWSPSGVPAITDPVVIQHDVTVDINNAKALSIDIETGNTLTINAGKALIIEKTLTKAGGATAAADVIINSTRDDGTGALIIGDYSSASNAATVNFETRAKRDGSGNWINQFVGSPFSNCAPYVDYAIQMYAFAPWGNGDHGGWWSTVNSGSTLTPFIGYTILYNSADELDVTWTGSLNATSDITLNGSNTNLYYSANPTDNLLANSWMAPIHMDEFDEDDFTNIEKTIYIFNSGSPQDYEKAEATSSLSSNTSTAAGTYVSIPVSSSPWIEGMPKVIPAMQGFAVLATGSSPSLKLEYDKLVYTPALTSVGIIPNRAPKRAAAEDAPDVITLRVQGENGWAANAYVLGREDFTNGFDDGWDGRFMEGEETAPQLYAPTPDGEMMVNCVPEIEGTVMAFHAGSLDNSYTCTFVYNGGEIWYLNDLKEEKSTLISNETSYPFVSVAGDKAARFVISKTPINKIVTDIDEANGEKDAKVRKLLIDDHIYIIRGGKMYTADGALVK